MKKLGGLFEVGKVVLGVFISALIIRSFVFQPFVVEGKSMEPSFYNGEYVMVEKVSYHLHQPKRGDVIVFRYPNDPSINYIKRIIGLPGDTVRIENGKVSVNGTQLNESYLTSDEQTIVARNPDIPYEVTVGKDQYFVMGDNREHSADSREGWLVNKDLIIGRSSLVINPTHNSTATASQP